MNEQLNQKPASTRQTWVLFRITGIDYRKANLSYEEADKMIQEANNKSGYKKPIKTAKNSLKTQSTSSDLENEFITYIKNNMYKVVEACNDERKEESVIMNDTKYVKDDGKRYLFFGGGCGIVWFKFDKRNKIAAKINDLNLKHRLTTFTRFFENHFSADELEYHNKVGFPIGAMFQQSLQTKLAYYDIVQEFMMSKGVKNVRVEYRYD